MSTIFETSQSKSAMLMKVVSHSIQRLPTSLHKRDPRMSGTDSWVVRKGQVTIVACSNAVEQTIPPMVIFDAKNLNHAWTKNEVPGTKYGLSDNGWINTGLFES